MDTSKGPQYEYKYAKEENVRGTFDDTKMGFLRIYDKSAPKYNQELYQVDDHGNLRHSDPMVASQRPFYGSELAKNAYERAMRNFEKQRLLVDRKSISKDVRSSMVEEAEDEKERQFRLKLLFKDTYYRAESKIKKQRQNLKTTLKNKDIINQA